MGQSLQARLRERLISAIEEGQRFSNLSVSERIELADQLIENAIKLKNRSSIRK